MPDTRLGPATDAPPGRGSSARRRCVRWPPSSTCARPSSGARTSSSTPTRCAASCASRASPRDDVVLEVGPGPRLADPGAARGGAPASWRSRSTRVLAGRAARHRRDVRPGPAPTGSTWSRPTRCASPSSPARRRPRWSPTSPTTSRSRCCSTCSPCCRRSSTGWSWCRPRSPTGSPHRPGSKVYGVPSVKAAWYADVRRAGAVGRNVFWPAPNVDSGLVAWTRRDPPATTASRAAGVRGRRRGLRPAPQDPARARCGSSPAPPRPPRPPWPRAGIDPQARGEVLDVARLRAHRRGAGPVTGADAQSVTVRAPAKINLHLGVGAPARGRLPPARRRSTRPSGCTTTCGHRRRPGWDVERGVADYVDAGRGPRRRAEHRRPRGRACSPPTTASP